LAGVNEAFIRGVDYFVVLVDATECGPVVHVGRARTAAAGTPAELTGGAEHSPNLFDTL
jgi:hypothetical protein